jgi:hypothetical protein
MKSLASLSLTLFLALTLSSFVTDPCDNSFDNDVESAYNEYAANLERCSRAFFIISSQCYREADAKLDQDLGNSIDSYLDCAGF